VNVNLPSFLLEKNDPPGTAAGKGRIRYAYLERGLAAVSSLVQRCFFDPASLSREGWLQKTDARIKTVLFAFLIVVISIKTRIASELAITALLAAMAVSTGSGIVRFYLRVFQYTILFGLAVTFPALLNIITPGHVILTVLELAEPHTFWLYHIPKEIGVTAEGLQAVSLLNLRILNSITVASLIVRTTPFGELMKALKVFKVPETLLVIITLSHKYIFIMARTIDDMFLARKSRLIGHANDKETRAWAAGRMAYLFRKSRTRYEDIFRAMEARGFRDEVRLPAFAGLSGLDRLSCGIFFLAGLFLLWI
jgi:cobalt/nickel transport system permease protein